MPIKTQLVRIDNTVVKELKQYCLNKHGKVQGMMVLEASEAIRKHIKDGGGIHG